VKELKDMNTENWSLESFEEIRGEGLKA